jgi:hypothetical protein
VQTRSWWTSQGGQTFGEILHTTVLLAAFGTVAKVSRDEVMDMATNTMPSTFTLKKAPAAPAAALADEDRRSNDRAKFMKPIRIRRQNPSPAGSPTGTPAGAGIESGSEELGTMIDLSRDGLYVTARSHDYPLGTQLRLQLPSTGSEWTCEVVRTEVLPNGSLGMGVRIIR